MCIMSMIWEFEDCTEIKFKYGMDMTEGKSTIEYARFNHKEVLWGYGESIMRLYLTRPYGKQVATLDATWMVFRGVQEADKA
jgi:hypothetical protein